MLYPPLLGSQTLNDIREIRNSKSQPDHGTFPLIIAYAGNVTLGSYNLQLFGGL